MTHVAAATRAARAFFDEFVQAFASFSGEVIARRYAAPYMAMHADGSSDLYSSPQDTARYFQRVVDGYHAQGARSCGYKQLEVATAGPSHLFATVTWELFDQADACITAWRESYTLALRDGRYKVTSSIDH